MVVADQPRCSQCGCLNPEAARDEVWGWLCPPCAHRQYARDDESPLFAVLHSQNLR